MSKQNPPVPNPNETTTYKNYFAKQVYKLSLLGAGIAEIAVIFEVSEKKIREWMARNEEFRIAILQGGAEADANVAFALYNRAVGYEVISEKPFADPRTGEMIVVQYKENILPDVAAAQFWLKNRRRDSWKNTYKEEISSKHSLEEFSSKELKIIAGVKEEEEGK